ncbi:UNVERIFIED_CONTAM: protein NRT1/ PTR FAMILY 6.3 [Sesamum radiatum]|uniref:Protein NRT1/ PTR FAMILY 6.3 n=1 Tax=Sesamum radiatum TaxID=300843 RepID=A0AAW2JPN5_SESRA
MIKFFNWFFFFINVGSLIAVTVLVYIQDNVGREWGYGICACAIVVALAVFLSGTRRYRFKKLVGSPLTQIAAVFLAAWKKRHLDLPSDPSLLFDDDDIVAGEGQRKKKKQKLPHSKEFRFLDKAAVKDSQAGAVSTNKWHLSTLTDVEEVKVHLTVFFVGSILLTVPIYDRIIVPIARRVLKNPHGLSPLQRIAVGLVLSIVAMVAAALTEIKRLKVARSHGLTHNETTTVPMSVFWECPKGMKTMSTGLFLSTLSLGFFFSSILVTIVHKVTGQQHPWLADNLNAGKLYNFYWLLTVLSIFNLMIFLFCARRYVYKEKRLAQEGIEMEEQEATFHA